MKLNFNYQFAKKFFREEEITNMKPFAELANEILEKGTGAGNDFAQLALAGASRRRNDACRHATRGSLSLRARSAGVAGLCRSG